MAPVRSPEWPVLIVDDEEHALQSTERVLVSAGVASGSRRS